MPIRSLIPCCLLTSLAILLARPAEAMAPAPVSATVEDRAPASAPSPSAQQFLHVAVAGFELAPGADDRDKWLPTGIEEVLAWRLRRVPGLLTVPAPRTHQARRELLEEGGELPPWPRVIAAMGPDYMLTGRCAGPPFEATLHLAVLEFVPGPQQGDSPAPRSSYEARVRCEVDLPAGKLFDVLDAGTRWALEQFEVRDVPEPLREMIFGPPCRSPSALEYYAKALAAARADDPRSAYEYVLRSLGYDEQFRPALALMIQLEVQSGVAVREAGRHLRIWAELARIYSDPVDLAAAELGLGAVLHMQGVFDAAYERYENALAMANADNSPYGQIMAANSLSDLYLSRRLLPQPALPDAQLRSLAEQDLRHAAAWQEVALELVAALQDAVAEAPSANKLALTYEKLGDWKAAIAMHQRSLVAAQRAGSRRNEAAAWLCLAQSYQRVDDAEQALAAGTRSLELASSGFQPVVRITLAGIHQQLSQPAAALDDFEQAYRKLRQSDDLNSQLLCIKSIADLRMSLGRREEAISALKEALEIAHALSSPEETSLREQLTGWMQASP
jgi:tetratricopeptide (TPR) repeat protein